MTNTGNVLPPLPRNERAFAFGLDALPATGAEGFAAAFDDQLTRNPTASLGRMADRLQFYPSTDEFGNELPARTPSRLLTPQEANDTYGIPGHLKFDSDTPEPIAQELKNLKQQELQRQDVMRRAEAGVGTNLTAGLVASLLDPLNVASAFVPVVGEARYAAMVARAGVSVARVARGAIEGAVGAAILEPLVLSAARFEQADYDAVDSLYNIAFGTALGAGLHLGAGAVSDRLAARREGSPIERAVDDLPRADQEALLRTAVAQVAEGRSVDIGPVLEASQSTRSRLMSGTAALRTVDDIQPEIRLNIETPGADDFFRRIAPDLADKVDELKTRQETYRRWLDELRDPAIDQVAQPFDARIAELEAQRAKASAKNRARIGREIDTLLSERDAAVRAASAADSPDMVRVREELLATDIALRDIAESVSRVTAKAERKAEAAKLEAERLTNMLAPVLERGRAADEIAFPLAREPDARMSVDRAVEMQRTPAADDPALGAAIDQRFSEVQARPAAIEDELKAVEAELQDMAVLMPAEREGALATTDAEKEANVYAKGWEAAVACRVRKA